MRDSRFFLRIPSIRKERTNFTSLEQRDCSSLSSKSGVTRIKIYSFIYTIVHPLSIIYSSSSHLFARGKETVLEVLLALPFGVHGIENRLPLRLIPLSQFLDLALHFRVQASHSLLQFLVREKLQLQDIVVSLYICTYSGFSLFCFYKNV